jgi:hypothetical protein
MGTMSGAMGHYRRLTGTLRMNGSSPLLEADDSLFFRLTTNENLRDLDGCHVIVEGNLASPDRLQVEWISRQSA